MTKRNRLPSKAKKNKVENATKKKNLGEGQLFFIRLFFRTSFLGVLEPSVKSIFVSVFFQAFRSNPA